MSYSSHTDTPVKNPFFWLIIAAFVAADFVYFNQIARALNWAYDGLLGKGLEGAGSTIHSFIQSVPTSVNGCGDLILDLLFWIVAAIVTVIAAIVLGVLFLVSGLLLFLCETLHKSFLLMPIVGTIAAKMTYRYVETAFFAVIQFFVGLWLDIRPKSKVPPERRAEPMPEKEDQKPILQGEEVEQAAAVIKRGAVALGRPTPAPDGLFSAYLETKKLAAHAHYYQAQAQVTKGQRAVIQEHTGGLQDLKANQEAQFDLENLTEDLQEKRAAKARQKAAALRQEELERAQHTTALTQEEVAQANLHQQLEGLSKQPEPPKKPLTDDELAERNKAQFLARARITGKTFIEVTVELEKMCAGEKQTVQDAANLDQQTKDDLITRIEAEYDDLVFRARDELRRGRK